MGLCFGFQVPLGIFSGSQQTNECLGAPIAMLVDQVYSRLYVASYHHNAISVFDTNSLGELWAHPTSQCIAVEQPDFAVGYPAGWHPRGVAGMAMADTTAGCYGDDYPRCLYVLNSAQGDIHVFAVEPVNASLRWVAKLSDGDAGAPPPSPRIPASIIGLAGVRAFHVSPSGAFAYAGGHGAKAVAAFTRDVADGALQFVDMVRQGEKLFWEFGTDIPGPSPQLLSEQTGPGPDTTALSSVPMRVDSEIESVFETVHFELNGTDYLVAACGARGAILYSWSVQDGNFSRAQQIGLNTQPDSNAVGVAVARIGAETLLVVSNWMRDGVTYTGSRVFRWAGPNIMFEYLHTLASSPPAADTVAYRQISKFSRRAVPFRIAADTFLAVPWYGWNAGTGEIAFSIVYKWTPTTPAFQFHQQFAVPGAMDAAFLASDADAGFGAPLLVFTSLFSFASGCAASAQTAVCSGVRSAASSAVVLRWNATLARFAPLQLLPTVGAVDATAFRLPCACGELGPASCMRDYLLVANRQDALPEEATPALRYAVIVCLHDCGWMAFDVSVHLGGSAFDQEPGLFTWDGGAFVPLSMGSFESLPAPPFEDACQVRASVRVCMWLSICLALSDSPNLSSLHLSDSVQL